MEKLIDYSTYKKYSGGQRTDYLYTLLEKIYLDRVKNGNRDYALREIKRIQNTANSIIKSKNSFWATEYNDNTVVNNLYNYVFDQINVQHLSDIDATVYNEYSKILGNTPKQDEENLFYVFIFSREISFDDINRVFRSANNLIMRQTNIDNTLWLLLIIGLLLFVFAVFMHIFYLGIGYAVLFYMKYQDHKFPNYYWFLPILPGINGVFLAYLIIANYKW